MPLSRREMMRGAAALGSLASIGGMRTANAGTPRGALGAPHTLISPDYFNLATKTTASFQATNYLTGLRAGQSHYQVQGLAIDSRTDSFFIAQTPNPDHPELTMTIGGSSWTADPYDPHASGDLVISRFDLSNGQFQDSMYFVGSGHGGQLAIEPGSPRASVWAEAYPGNPRTSGNPPTVTSSQVFGTRIARLPYAGGRLMTNTEVVSARYGANPYLVARYGPIPGAHEYNASIDTSTAFPGATGGVLVLRYRLNTDPPAAPRRFAAYDLAAARGGDFSTALATAVEPDEITGGTAHSEGFATCGQFIYVVGIDGTGVRSLYEIDFNGLQGSYQTKLPLPGGGEPESVALYAPNGSPSRLYYLTSSTTRPRTFDLYFLNT